MRHLGISSSAVFLFVCATDTRWPDHRRVCTALKYEFASGLVGPRGWCCRFSPVQQSRATRCNDEQSSVAMPLSLNNLYRLLYLILSSAVGGSVSCQGVIRGRPDYAMHAVLVTRAAVMNPGRQNYTATHYIR